MRDLCELLERFERRGVALISVAESLDTSSAAGRLVINIMTAVSQWEREAIGERTRDAMSHKKSQGERVGNIAYGLRLGEDGVHLEHSPDEQAVLAEIRQTAWPRYDAARDRCRTESRSPSDPTRLSVAAGARGENHEAGRSGLLAQIVSTGLCFFGRGPVDSPQF